MIVKVTRNYQITIPADIRDKVNLRIGDLVDVVYDNDRKVIIIRKVKQDRKTLKAGKMLTPEDIERLIVVEMEENL